MSERTYTCLFPFAGIGAGARGFLDAQLRLLGREVRFRSLGGIDLDPLACQDFERLTGSPALCADVARMTPAELRDFAGAAAPDVVFSSPPCKSFSGLLSKKAAALPQYVQMSRLVLDWTRLMLEAWPTPPRLVLIENVPRIASRGAPLLAEVKQLLGAAGYVFHQGSHDCGELGGLAQHRQRFLLVARQPSRASALLYQPPKKRVRACGEVLESLPMPGDPAAGPMHQLPRISWLNWVRLALIPAGGDWRDLPGTLEEGQARREVFRRYHVGRWDRPVATVAGGGTNGPTAVADPRLAAFGFKGAYGVTDWAAPAGTVTGESLPPNGRFAVADPRAPWAVKVAYDHGYGVLSFGEPSPTVAGGSHPGQGAYSVADPRLTCQPRSGVYGVLSWQEAAKTITGSAGIDTGAFAVADPRVESLRQLRDARQAPADPPIIIAADGTWHRPLTTLELAVLQGLPPLVDGEPLQLAGKSTNAWRGRIGNCVPPPASQAIAEQMLTCLASADLGAWSLSSGGGVWVREDREEAACAGG